MSSGSWPSFQTRVRGKWILAGEHAVLRGATALALPHPENELVLEFRPGGAASEGLKIVPETAREVILEMLEAVSEDQQAQDRVFALPPGTLELRSSIPVGAGLGSSAALCVALSRWLSEPLRIPEPELFHFATQLEHRFHGRSSGMDVAVIASGEPISFVIPAGQSIGRATPLGIRRIPRFTFHDTGLRTRTSECVLRVEKLKEEDPVLAMKIDEAMGVATRLATEGLIRYDADGSTQALGLIAQAMRQAQECFYSWQLVPGVAKRLEEELMGQGALAVKMTGAGGGGMVVALWSNG